MEPYYDQDGITIYHGDCRDVLPTLGRFDLLLTDPPYGVNWQTPVGPGRRPPRKVRGDDSPFDTSCIQSVANHSIVWGANYFAAQLPVSAGWLIWDKRVTEWTNDQADCELAWSNIRTPARVFRKHWGGGGCAAKENGSGVGYLHPTQKPIALMRWCLSFAPDAQTILDPFMGSGTTLVAAQLEGKQAVGIELEERYCEIAANRLRQKTLF